MQKTGADILWECLPREEVRHIFGYPGGAILPAYDAMARYPIYHILVRHEQGATHAADGYARASGKVGVTIATSGPGDTNMVTGIATAMMDSSPIVCITGQVPSTVLGTDAFQEIDITGITLPIPKHNYLVESADEIAPAIREAFHIARSRRPGPVLVDITKDAQKSTCELVWPETPSNREFPHPQNTPAASDYAEAIRLVRAAKCPLILAGQGIIHSEATEVVKRFAEQEAIPVVVTLLGIGSFPASQPLQLGMMGMHGEAWVNTAIQEADLLLAFGMRFDDRVTGNPRTYAPRAKKIHLDIDPAEINKNVKVDVALPGDLKLLVSELLARLKVAKDSPSTRDSLGARFGTTCFDGTQCPCQPEHPHGEWIFELQKLRGASAVRDIQNLPSLGHLCAAHVIHDLWRETEGRALVVTDVGQHQMWEAQYYRHKTPRSLITSGGLGTMGFALSAAIGAKLARPEAEVLVIVGDGGFQMTLAELATIVQEKLDIKIAIINNGFLGMVRQWQEFFYDGRYVSTPLLSPDFVKLAAAYGIPAVAVTTREQARAAVRQARQTPGPALIEFQAEPQDSVYPMVPSEADLHQMIRRPNPLVETP